MGKTWAAFSEQVMSVGGHSVYIRSNAMHRAQTIIMVHGIGVSGEYYKLFAQALAATFHVVVIDLPGYGKTPKPDTALTIEQLALALGEFIRTQNIIAPILVGHSMGCQVVARLVASAPKLIAQMILLAPTINKRERIAPVQLLRLLQDSTREPYVVNKILTKDYIGFGFMRYLQTQRYMLNDAIENHLPLCTVPSLVVCGGRDKIVPLDWSHFVQAQLPQAEFVAINGGAHVFQYTHAHELEKICVDFIAQ